MKRTDTVHFDAYDMEKVQKAYNLLLEVQEYNYEEPTTHCVIKRLNTIVSKLDELIKINAQNEAQENNARLFCKAFLEAEKKDNSQLKKEEDIDWEFSDKFKKSMSKILEE